MRDRDLGREVHRFQKSESDDLVIGVTHFKGRRWIHLASVISRPHPPCGIEAGQVRAYVILDDDHLQQLLEGIERLKAEFGIAHPEPLKVIIEKVITTVNPQADNGQETNKEAI